MRNDNKVLCNSKEYGERVRELRKQRGLNEAQLGAEIGLSQGSISNLEKGNRKFLAKSIVERLIQVFGPSNEITEQLRKGTFSDTNKLEFASKSASRNCSVTFRDSYPGDYGEQLASAEELWLSGANLRRLLPEYEEELTAVLNAGGKIRALLVNPDPRCHANKYSAVQDRGPKANIRSFRGTITSALDALCELRKSTGSGKRLAIKVVDYPLPFGLDIKNPANGIVYLRHYPMNRKMRRDPLTRDKPIIVLTKADGFWYDFYVEQFRQQWDWPTSVQWNCGRHKKRAKQQTK